MQIGQRKEMSNIDIQRINKLYDCGEHITQYTHIVLFILNSILDSNDFTKVVQFWSNQSKMIFF